MVKKLSLALITAILVLGTASCSAVALSPSEDDPNDNFYPLLTRTEEQVLAISFAVLFAVGALWAAWQLRASFRTEHHSTDGAATDEKDATELPPT
ncbi:MAG: hypothetical protein HY874_01775 [Chloroflexi bacterium]|nr:hypothetical protein [Chloroflexota bacterium]